MIVGLNDPRKYEYKDEGGIIGYIEKLVEKLPDLVDPDGEIGRVQQLIDELTDAGWKDLSDWFRENVGDPFAAAIRDALRRLLDPIVFDMDGDGIELLAREAAQVFFDMDGDGRKELTGWVAPDDALLVRDANLDGQVESIDELVGDLGQSGFAELATFDGNADRVIDASDAVWATLRVWQDINTNGTVEEGELRTLTEAQITAIDLNFTTVNFTAAGNQIHEQSVYEKADGTTGLVVDAWFDVDNVIAERDPSETGEATIDALPDVPGSGDLPSLRTAMLGDGALTSLVSGLIARPLTQLDGVRQVVEQILYRWADAQDIAPASRGGLFDARALSVLEQILGTPYRVGTVTNPTAAAVGNLTLSWNALVDGLTGRLLLAGPLGDLLPTTLYSSAIDRLVTVESPEALLAQLSDSVPTITPLDTAEFWMAALPVARAIFEERGLNTRDAAYRGSVAAALQPFGLAPFEGLLSGGIAQLTAEPQAVDRNGMYRGTTGADVYVVETELQAIYGLDGNDRISVTNGSASARTLLSGDAGNDTLTGNVGADWLDGGAGIDDMAGGTGDDTYVLSDIRDTITEIAGAGIDTVRAPFNYTLANTLENLTLTGATATLGTGNALANVIIGNALANTLSGLDGNDRLDGGAGGDLLRGGEGNDRYVVDDARDRIVEAGLGIDSVESSVSFILRDKVEHLILTGSADLSGTGNAYNNEIIGNSGANRLDGRLGADYLAGGLGDDTYVVDNVGDRVVEALNAGNDKVIASVSFTLGNNIELLALTGTDDIFGVGNTLANTLTGNAGDNYLDGGAGDDRLQGGLGDDRYIVDATGDVVIEAVAAGIDRVETRLASYTLGANVENLRLVTGTTSTAPRSGTGNSLDNVIEGNAGIDTLVGAAGNDSLFGFAGNDDLLGGDGMDVLDGGLGADRMTGGVGDDIYIVSATDDVVVEGAGGGFDTIVSAVSYILSANVEAIELIGTAAIDAQGNTLDNRLTGNGAANVLDGGLGSDLMIGGTGDDTYILSDTGDVISEGVGAGTDTVFAPFSYTLFGTLENLVLTGAVATIGTGNAAANRITGNALANTLSGLAGDDRLDGGAGADILHGGEGDDRYIIDDTRDRIVEAGLGIDIVESSVNFVLRDKIEHLILTGTADISGTGNTYNNEIIGNAGANRLDGRLGADYLAGGLGDDTYIVDDAGDRVVEALNAGNDKVIASVSYTIGSNVEALALTGTDDIFGVGNTLANTLTGNAGDNYLDGGAGDDRLQGGLGDDRYIVDSLGDTVVELLAAGTDRIETRLASYTLGNNVENLRLLAASSNTTPRFGTGNILDNIIEGGTAIDTLDGGGGNDTLFGFGENDVLTGGDGADLLDGGAGADRMTGGAGDDSYILSGLDDVVIEASGGGFDTVFAAFSYILGAHLEALELTGTAAIDGQGNELDNRLVGTTNANNLDGGIGADTMAGGFGDDVYTVDNAGDVVIETVGAGVDTVRASIGYTIGRGINNLTLLGSAPLRGTGNEYENTIEGNAGNNVLIGGLGRDILSGGAGADRFAFANRTDSGKTTSLADVILDFTSTAGDRIDVSGIDAILGTGANDAFSFIGTAAFSAAGQVRTFVSGRFQYLVFNTDSDLATTEMVIALQDVTTPLDQTALIL